MRERAIQFQYGPGTFGKGGSLSGSNIFPDQGEGFSNDIEEETPSVDALDYAEPGEHPKVLFN